MMTPPPFMSMIPGPRAVAVVEALELLKRAVGLEHSVEMTDEQESPAAAGMIGDQVARALERRAVDPSRLEAKLLELGGEELADLPHAGEVLRAAVDVDRALEERERLGPVSIDMLDNPPLVTRQAALLLPAARGHRHGRHEQTGQDQ